MERKLIANRTFMNLKLNVKCNFDVLIIMFYRYFHVSEFVAPP